MQIRVRYAKIQSVSPQKRVWSDLHNYLNRFYDTFKLAMNE